MPENSAVLDDLPRELLMRCEWGMMPDALPCEGYPQWRVRWGDGSQPHMMLVCDNHVRGFARKEHR